MTLEAENPDACKELVLEMDLWAVSEDIQTSPWVHEAQMARGRRHSTFSINSVRLYTQKQ